MKTITLLWNRFVQKVRLLGNQKRIDTRALPLSAERKAELHPKIPVRLTQEVRDFLQSNYDFRYNVLTEETEFRPANKRSTPFIALGKRELNTFCMEAHDQGIACWDKDLSRYVYSTCIPEYHPFHLYMEELPEWDGIDRVKTLAQRVSSDPLWIKSFHIWMLALAAQWMGINDIHANSVAPILVSSEQGRQKSTLFDFSKLCLA